MLNSAHQDVSNLIFISSFKIPTRSLYMMWLHRKDTSEYFLPKIDKKRNRGPVQLVDCPVGILVEYWARESRTSSQFCWIPKTKICLKNSRFSYIEMLGDPNLRKFYKPVAPISLVNIRRVFVWWLRWDIADEFLGRYTIPDTSSSTEPGSECCKKFSLYFLVNISENQEFSLLLVHCLVGWKKG